MHLPHATQIRKVYQKITVYNNGCVFRIYHRTYVIVLLNRSVLQSFRSAKYSDLRIGNTQGVPQTERYFRECKGILT